MVLSTLYRCCSTVFFSSEEARLILPGKQSIAECWGSNPWTVRGASRRLESGNHPGFSNGKRTIASCLRGNGGSAIVNKHSLNPPIQRSGSIRPQPKVNPTSPWRDCQTPNCPWIGRPGRRIAGTPLLKSCYPQSGRSHGTPRATRTL